MTLFGMISIIVCKHQSFRKRRNSSPIRVKNKTQSITTQKRTQHETQSNNKLRAIRMEDSNFFLVTPGTSTHITHEDVDTSPQPICQYDQINSTNDMPKFGKESFMTPRRKIQNGLTLIPGTSNLNKQEDSIANTPQQLQPETEHTRRKLEDGKNEFILIAPGALTPSTHEGDTIRNPQQHHHQTSEKDCKIMVPEYFGVESFTTPHREGQDCANLEPPPAPRKIKRIKTSRSSYKTQLKHQEPEPEQNIIIPSILLNEKNLSRINTRKRSFQLQPRGQRGFYSPPHVALTLSLKDTADFFYPMNDVINVKKSKEESDVFTKYPLFENLRVSRKSNLERRVLFTASSA